MKKGYREGSRISKALDYIVRQGIDCIKISGTKHAGDKATFFPLCDKKGRNFIDRACRAGWIVTDDYMEIETERMSGKEIMELNSELKLEHDKRYDVLMVGYR